MSRSIGKRSPFTKSLVRMAASAWLCFGAVLALGSAAILDSLGYRISFAVGVILLGALVGISLLLVSSKLRTPRRVVSWAILMGVLVVPMPCLMFFFMGTAYFTLIPQSPPTRILQWLTVCFATIVWIGIDLRALQRRVVEKRYLEREFVEFADHVALRWDRGTDIEPPPISDSAFLGRVWRQHGFKLVVAIAPLSGAGYASARLLDRAGGVEGVLLFLAVLGLPLCLYILSKLVCGTYLNVYKVLQVERRTGKPVLFDHIPAE